MKQFTEKVGITSDISYEEPIDFFSLFFNEEVFDFIATNTNEYAREKSSMHVREKNNSLLLHSCIILSCISNCLD